MKEMNLNKTDILEKLSLSINKWKSLKNEKQDVTHENFIDDVILVYQWVMADIEKM